MEQQLKPFLPNSFSVSSSTEFVNHLSSLKPQSSEICVSFDIKSLFTHVPLMEVVEDITSTVYSHTAKSSIFANSKTITKKIFRNILQVCSESIFFITELYTVWGHPLLPFWPTFSWVTMKKDGWLTIKRPRPLSIVDM